MLEVYGYIQSSGKYVAMIADKLPIEINDPDEIDDEIGSYTCAAAFFTDGCKRLGSHAKKILEQATPDEMEEYMSLG